MSIKIGTGVSPVYDPSLIRQASSVAASSRISKPEEAQAPRADEASKSSQYISPDHGGVVQTRVSDANAFQKSQIKGSREAIEDMAGKLMSKLPNILSDMQRLPAAAGAEDQAAATERVAVTERNAALVADRQAQQTEELQNFAL